MTTDLSKAGKIITTTTIYIGNAVYESRTTSPANVPNDEYTDILQFIAHEEGTGTPSGLVKSFNLSFIV
ncbi:hypothetical protein [Niastella populi]|uniref:Uncharacterized protein n=1 Tax=Niastella populi TaxID=550983 RepID=A0A1V9EGP6_9BACT|nr:hypothetical protein [Niastella populi]OQP45308.1 hypothetical protein A4R26_32360 [Niastella populi]